MAQRAFITRAPKAVSLPATLPTQPIQEEQRKPDPAPTPAPIIVKKRLSTHEIAELQKGKWGCTNPQQHWGFHYWRTSVPLDSGEPVNQRVCNVCHWDTAGLGHRGPGGIWQFPEALRDALTKSLDARYGPGNWKNSEEPTLAELRAQKEKGE